MAAAERISEATLAHSSKTHARTEPDSPDDLGNLEQFPLLTIDIEYEPILTHGKQQGSVRN